MYHQVPIHSKIVTFDGSDSNSDEDDGDTDSSKYLDFLSRQISERSPAAKLRTQQPVAPKHSPETQEKAPKGPLYSPSNLQPQIPVSMPQRSSPVYVHKTLQPPAPKPIPTKSKFDFTSLSSQLPLSKIDWTLGAICLASAFDKKLISGHSFTVYNGKNYKSFAALIPDVLRDASDILFRGQISYMKYFLRSDSSTLSADDVTVFNRPTSFSRILPNMSKAAHIQIKLLLGSLYIRSISNDANIGKKTKITNNDEQPYQVYMPGSVLIQTASHPDTQKLSVYFFDHEEETCTEIMDAFLKGYEKLKEMNVYKVVYYGVSEEMKEKIQTEETLPGVFFIIDRCEESTLGTGYDIELCIMTQKKKPLKSLLSATMRDLFINGTKYRISHLIDTSHTYLGIIQNPVGSR